MECFKENCARYVVSRLKWLVRKPHNCDWIVNRIENRYVSPVLVWTKRTKRKEMKKEDRPNHVTRSMSLLILFA